MKILYANTYYAPHITGGAEVIAQSMAEGMVARGHQVAVVTTSNADAVDNINGVEVHRVKQRNLFWKLPKDSKPAWQKMVWHGVDRHNHFMDSPLDQVLTKVAPDLLVTNNLSGLSIALWLQAKKRHIPIVHVLHDYYLICPSVTMHRPEGNCDTVCARCKLFRGPHAEASDHVDAVVGVSRAILNTHLKHGLFAATPTKQVIYNARDLPQAPQRAPLAGTDRPVVFGFIGALTKVKGIEPLIHAFIKARQTTPNTKLLVAGSGDQEYEQHLKSLAPADAVEFVGQANAMRYFSAIDVCVAPSQWHDPLPGVVFEALSQGVPVIGTTRGGIPEMVQDQVNGLIVDPSEPKALELAIVRLAQDRAQIDQFSKAACSTSSQFTNFARVVDEYETLFNQTTNGP